MNRFVQRGSISQERGVLARLDAPSAVATGLLALIGVVAAWLNARAYGQELLSSSSLFLRMSIWVAIATTVYLVVAANHWSWVRTFAWPLYGANVTLLVVTLVYGVDSGGNARALAIFGITIQSSEISKVIATIAVATALTRVGRTRGGVRDVLLAGAVIGPLFLLVAMQPDLGTGLVLLFALFGALLFSGVASRWLAALAALGAAVVPIAWVFVIREYQKERLLAFIDPHADPAGPKYQLTRSINAIAGGGLFGVGFDGSASVAPLPVQESDFVFASLVRATGLIGGLLVIGLLALLAARLVMHAWNSNDAFGVILAGGMASIVTFQAVINIGMNLGVAPITGIPLPFVSYGGASVVSLAFGLGLVQSHVAYGGTPE